MGRYAFFSTGFEYKFAFGIQCSADIRFFSGVVTITETDLKKENYRHAWNQSRDSDTIFNTLKNFWKDPSFPFPDFTEFEPTLKGTHMLNRWFYANIEKLHEYLGDECHTFKLGCLIYHQLKYEPNLTARYEPF